jgi:CRP-like cAMP-binding protein
MTRQGAVAHWLYLIVSGSAEVSVETPAGKSIVGALEAGAIFGEMGMLTGAPRSATVTARTDTICYRLDKAGFESVIRGRPDVAEAITRVLAARRRQTESEVAAAHAAGHAMRHDDILEKVRRFFGLAQD